MKGPSFVLPNLPIFMARSEFEYLTLKCLEAAQVGADDLVGINIRVAEIISGDCLLGKRSEISCILSVRELNDDGSILPNVVVVVVVVASHVNKALATPLVHVNVMNPVSLSVKSTEEIRIPVI